MLIGFFTKHIHHGHGAIGNFNDIFTSVIVGPRHSRTSDSHRSCYRDCIIAHVDLKSDKFSITHTRLISNIKFHAQECQHIMLRIYDIERFGFVFHSCQFLFAFCSLTKKNKIISDFIYSFPKGKRERALRTIKRL